MREPYDYDPDREEQRQVKRRLRLDSLVCHCGKPKQQGQWQCRDCDELDQEEMASLNPPNNED